MHNMPKYKCFKEVHAAEIHMISIGPDVVITFDDCEPMHFKSEDYIKMVSRYNPKRGDFLVVYADGYKSFSPAKAFLEGYSKV